MKTVLAALAAAAAFIGAAHAGDDVMASRYGNTTVVTMANGVVVKLWYNPDHTWTGDAAGMAMSGTWEVKDGQLCVTNANPPPNMPNPNCNPVEAHKIGDHWTTGTMSATLVEGKQ